MRLEGFPAQLIAGAVSGSARIVDHPRDFDEEVGGVDHGRAKAADLDRRPATAHSITLGRPVGVDSVPPLVMRALAGNSPAKDRRALPVFLIDLLARATLERDSSACQRIGATPTVFTLPQERAWALSCLPDL